jgi:hypothetical protein
MGQSKATQWIQVLLPVRRAAFEALGDGPTRTLATLAQGLSVAAAIVVALLPRAEPDPPPLPAPSTSVAAPLLPTMGPKGGSIAPKIRLSRSAVIAARRRATP